MSTGYLTKLKINLFSHKETYWLNPVQLEKSLLLPLTGQCEMNYTLETVC